MQTSEKKRHRKTTKEEGLRVFMTLRVMTTRIASWGKQRRQENEGRLVKTRKIEMAAITDH